MKERIINAIKKHRGRANIIAIPQEFLKFTGDVNSALLLSQLVYWTDRTKDENGWIYKSYDDWEKELTLNKYKTMTAKKHLEKLGVIETKAKKVKNLVYVHYRLTDKFETIFIDYLKTKETKDKNIRKLKNQTSESKKFRKSKNQTSEGLEIKNLNYEKSKNLISENKNFILPTDNNITSIIISSTSNNINNNTSINTSNTSNINTSIITKTTRHRLHTETIDENIQNDSVVLIDDKDKKIMAWKYFLSRYQSKYNSSHLQNAKTMSQFTQIWKQSGERIYDLIDAFLDCNEYWYIKNCHQIGLLLKDIQKFFVLSSTGKKMITKKEAEKIEKESSSYIDWERIKMIDEEYEKYKAEGGDKSIVEFTMDFKKKNIS